MIAWILIVVSSAYNGVTTYSIGFSSEAACYAGAAAVKQAADKVRDGRYVALSCVKQ